MQIALTKKLAAAMGIKPAAANDTAEPLFSWTANWTNTFERYKEDMVVMVNNANRFTVTIYGVKRNQFKGIEKKITAAVRNTLLTMNLNPEIVEEYIERAGDVEFVANHDRKFTSWVNRQGLDASYIVGRAVNRTCGELKFDDTLGHIVSNALVSVGGNQDEYYIPASKMIEALTELTGKPAYKYRAFELLVTLDLGIYKAMRRFIVPADIEFAELHEVLQSVFDWDDCHLHDFKVFADNRAIRAKRGKRAAPVVQLVMNGEAVSDYYNAVMETEHKLSEYFPKYKSILYTYDMGDCWEHVIELARVIEDHNEDSPYLLEAIGQAPPDDVGGVGGFIDFRKIMLDPNHPDHDETKRWAAGWSPELREWKRGPGVIRY
jgi:hypothetical protein